MKKLIIIFALIFFASIESSSARNYGGDVSFNFFYAKLQPYGEWIEIDYDVYAWRPTTVHFSWKPYTLGRWEYTSYGWYWDSFEPFGWATYHYGRWYNDDYYGWVWLPDYEWGPSWVEWRYNDYYIGWAPLPPYAAFRMGLGIHFSINWHSHHHHWNFVRYNHFHHHNINRYLIGSRDRYKIFSNTKYRTNYYSNNGRIINGGVDRTYIERRTGSRIQEKEIFTTNKLRNDVGARNRDDRIEIYRPAKTEIEKTRTNDYNFKKSEGRTSLDTKKITTRRENVPDNRERINNTDKSTSSRNTDIKKKGDDSSRELSRDAAKRETKETPINRKSGMNENSNSLKKSSSKSYNKGNDRSKELQSYDKTDDSESRSSSITKEKVIKRSSPEKTSKSSRSEASRSASTAKSKR